MQIALDSSHQRLWAHILLALLAFLTGLVIGRIGAMRGGSRSGDGPAPMPVPHPRTLGP
jgi:hypothetical protein